MKLSKFYSNNKDFKNVEFNLQGLNVIYSDVVTDRKDKKNSHDLGKTKLAELIDFMLLKQVSNQKKHFLFRIKDRNGDSIFINYIFYLEVKLNSGQFLTIRRSIESNTKISFAINDSRSNGFTPPNNWIHEDISFQSAKKVLSEYLAFDFFSDKKYDFRKAINYCLRLQGDYEDVYKLSKYVGGKDKDWKPFMFDLLGFDGSLLRDKYENDEKRENIKTYISQLTNEYSIKVSQRDDIVAQIKIVEEKYNEVEQQVDRFNFYEQDKNLIKEGIEDLEQSISELNSLSYELSYEIDKIEKSIKNKFAFNLDKVKKVFDEASIYFPDQLKKDYGDLISFNNGLTVERNKLLSRSLKAKNEERNEIQGKLKSLNEKREGLLSYLRDTDAFKKFKFYQKELVRSEGALLTIRNKLSNIDLILEKEAEREDLLKSIEGTIKSLKEIFRHTEDNKKYSDIRAKFSKYYREIMNEEARISWNINDNNNVEFLPPKVENKTSQKETAKDEGNTYRKLLCVAFDLAILSSYSNESYFKFVYHDDVLSQEDDGIKIRLLTLVREICKDFSLQYFLTSIRSDLPTNGEEERMSFPENEIVLTLHDKDPTGTLFGFEF